MKKIILFILFISTFVFSGCKNNIPMQVKDGDCLEKIKIERNTKEARLKEYNHKYFSSVEAVKAIYLSKGEEKKVTMSLLPLPAGPRELVKELLQNETVQTYEHLSSDLCLNKEENLDKEYTAYFDASHEYCTNECVTEEYKFGVKIDKITGEVKVFGM